MIPVISVWQTLPLGMTHSDGSPYQCLSAHAGNPDYLLILMGWYNWVGYNYPSSCEECRGHFRVQQKLFGRKGLSRFFRAS
jgi:4-alpha-glucanotransferase